MTATRKHIRFNRKFVWLTISIIVFVAVILHLYSRSHHKPHQHPAIPVVVAPVKLGNMPVYFNALGSVTPTYSVTVKTQINGTLLKVFFHEGQVVKSGEVIAQIDPRIYEAQLTEYQGQLLRDQALLKNAKLDLTRYQKLWKQDSVSYQTLTAQQSLVQQYQGAVQTDIGLIELTKVNLIYCKIIAPVTGRIGLRLVDPGNYVQTSDTNGIAIINTLDPITVVFSIPEDNLHALLPKLFTGQTYTVSAFDREQTHLLATGKVFAMDSQISASTGTVNLKAVFANPGNILYPSQFVNIQLLVQTLTHISLIPTAAIQYGNNGSFVYVLNDNQTVNVRSVKVAANEKDTSAIASGLKEGEQVVVEGGDNLTEGATVKTNAATDVAKL